MTKNSKGKIVQIIGTVVDVEFNEGELPALFNALEVEEVEERLVLEVEQHVGNNWVRCLSLAPTDGLVRGQPVTDTGQPILVPVGEGSLGRMFNVVGDPLDNLGDPKTEEYWPIHRAAPSFDEQATTTDML